MNSEDYGGVGTFGRLEAVSLNKIEIKLHDPGDIMHQTHPRKLTIHDHLINRQKFTDVNQ